MSDTAQKTAKLNCWEFMKCGREPGGLKAAELGICLASQDTKFNGVNEGINAGRACWLSCGTSNKGAKQGCSYQDAHAWVSCTFLSHVRREEGAAFDSELAKFLLTQSPDTLTGIVHEFFETLETLREKVAELDQAENAVKDGRAFTESALNAIPDLFFAFDLNGKLSKSNETLKNFSGYSEQELAQMKPADFFAGDDIERITATIGRVFSEGFATQVADLVTKDRTRISCEFNAAILRGGDGRVIGFTGTGREIGRAHV